MTMAKPQHRTPEHRAAYTQLVADQAAGRELWCVEPICKQTSRVIHPWQRASISHDVSGTVILGPSHLGCNLSEAAIRGNRMRGRKAKPPGTRRRPAGRWVL